MRKLPLMEFSKFYHIYNHSNGNENLFLSDKNYQFFLKKYAEHIYPACQTYAYCLMPNHFHLLVKVRSEEEIKTLLSLKDEVELNDKFISKRFSNLFSSYTQAFNKMYERKGSLFLKNFKRKEVNNEAYFTKLIHYIHFNPVHHGFIKNIDAWEWSSFRAFTSKQKSLLERDEVLKWFSGEKEYLKFHQRSIDERIAFDLEF